MAVALARSLYLCLQADATDETALRAAGTKTCAHSATARLNDAGNVFITLSGRSLNPALQIIARGELLQHGEEVVAGWGEHGGAAGP
jgi:Trk K+ transport system NAD-binding subunit